VGLWRYLRGTDVLEDRSTHPAGEARSLAMGEQSERLLYPTDTTPLVVGESNALRVADAWACLGSGWLVERSIPAGCRALRLGARTRAGLGLFGGRR
jgi:hypothetical protein